jgi:hypothetical protein
MLTVPSGYQHCTAGRSLVCAQKLLYTVYTYTLIIWKFNPLNTELNPICHLLALVGAHHVLHVSRVWVKILNTLYLFINSRTCEVTLCEVTFGAPSVSTPKHTFIWDTGPVREMLASRTCNELGPSKSIFFKLFSLGQGCQIFLMVGSQI